MRMTRVHVDVPLAVGTTVALPEAAAGHLLRVLRLQVGDACVLFNGDGRDYEAKIASAGKREASVQILSARDVDSESPLRIVLLQALARGEKMDWVVQKATELGVDTIMPVHTARSEVKLDGERADKRLAHWRSVAISACEQSGRARVPSLSAPAALVNALPQLPAATVRLLLDPTADATIGTLALATNETVVIAIGPEGGWSQDDLVVLSDAGFSGLRLGPRVLRTETAGPAAIAALLARYGDFA